VAEIGTAQVSSLQPSATEIGALQLGVAQAGVAQVCPYEIGVLEFALSAAPLLQQTQEVFC
jgi:hypothetical protein